MMEGIPLASTVAMQPIEWKDWEVFCRVVDGASFTAGADLAGVPKSSASASVTRLETHLGVRLLERTTRKVRVTAIGQQFYERIAPLFGELRDIESDVRSASGVVRGSLKIAAPYEVGAQYLSSSLAKLLEKHPDLQVQVAVNSSYPDLIRNDYDIAFVTTTDLLPDSSLAGKRVLRVERGFYAAPSFVDKMGVVTTPEELVSLPAIGDQDEKLWEFHSGNAEEIALSVKPYLRTENAEIRKKAVLQGLGVARFSYAFVHDEVKSGAISRILPDYASSPVKVYALMPARVHRPANVLAFLGLLESELHEPLTSKPA